MQRHSLHPKGWGEEEWLINIELYCAKILRVEKGKKCSVHYHKLKTETFTLLKGRIIVRYGDQKAALHEVVLEKNDTFHVLPGTLHQFEAVEFSEILEVSTQHFDSDSYRVVPGD